MPETLRAGSPRTVEPIVHDVLSLSDAADAHRQMDAGAVFGRIVLTP
jgi:NADPH2:quinone reductase